MPVTERTDLQRFGCETTSPLDRPASLGGLLSFVSDNVDYGYDDHQEADLTMHGTEM